jgi:hypothetical protein
MNVSLNRLTCTDGDVLQIEKDEITANEAKTCFARSRKELEMPSFK